MLDTTMLVSRLLVPTDVAARAVDHALALGVLLISDETLTELSDVLARPKFDRYVSRGDRQHFVRLLGEVAGVIPVTHRVSACRDPKDDKVPACRPQRRGGSDRDREIVTCSCCTRSMGSIL
jgi:putative PIN family toxin of toxin-antitoxin system